MRDSEKTKAAILRAAERVVAEKGIPDLTLEVVAVRTPVSKGGLLHHFPNKNALIAGLAQRMIEEHQEEIETHLRADPDLPGAYTRAYLRACLTVSDDDGEDCCEVCAKIMAESRNLPGVVNLFNDYSHQVQRRLAEDGLDPIIATLVRFTAEGLMSSATWGMPRPDNYDALVAYLFGLAAAQPNT